MTEEEAVSQMGSVDHIVTQILDDVPLMTLAKEKIKSQRKFKAWEMILLVLGSPIWLSLAIAALAVVLSLYVVLWSVVVSLWAVFGALVGCGFGGVVGGIILLCQGSLFSGMALIGTGVFASGLAIFMFFGCKLATKGTVLLTKKIVLSIKKCFVKKEGTS